MSHYLIGFGPSFENEQNSKLYAPDDLPPFKRSSVVPRAIIQRTLMELPLRRGGSKAIPVGFGSRCPIVIRNVPVNRQPAKRRQPAE